MAPAVVGAVAVAVVGLPALWLLTFGPLATHMALHIALISVIAPLFAMLLLELGVSAGASARMAVGKHCRTAFALWAVHAPEPARRSVREPRRLPRFFGRCSLASAVIFWLSVCSARPAQWWQAILALLVTGKLACLLGALLVFAPRPIYSVAHHGFDLADQQMAGLLMLAACPLSYVLAAIVIAVETLCAPATGRVGGPAALARQTA